MKLQMTSGPAFSSGRVSMLAEVGGLGLFLTRPADDPLSLVFGLMMVTAPRAGLTSSWGHACPLGPEFDPPLG